MQTPVASNSTGGDRQSRHPTSVTKLAASPFLKTLGFGTGVEVLRIKRAPSKNCNKSPWAIKMLSRRNTPEGAKLFGQRLTDEATILRQLDHPNIVGYRGFDSLDAGQEYIAMEYCNTSLGDLLEQRYEQKLGPLEAPKVKRMALDTLNALNYLHTEALILHGDLKSFNILVKDDFEVCKLCDFGVSLPLNKEGYLDTEKKKDAQYVGTGIWSAPEVLEEDVSLISSKADIFSFGLVIYETIALLPPHTFPGMKDESIASSADYAVMKSIIRGSTDNQPLPTNRKLDVSEVIVLDDESENEKSVSVKESGRKRKLSSEKPEAHPSKRSASEPDSTTADSTIISITDDSLQGGDTSVITLEDEDEDGEEDEEEYGEEEDELEKGEEGDYLDYGCLGTRPAIPEGLNLPEEYNFILEVFFVCTQEDYEARPSAKTLLDAWQKRAEAVGELPVSESNGGKTETAAEPEAAKPDDKS
ncbi:lymphokine-activated killer T-cell-originated protein kinase homolog isoform X2 [Sabethes cyaneus]|nr:lymphokine-activated killer T-cell-originated protein kinase homolog isoform X2 [Sabethes cyaneus]